jgi:protein SCO1/2
VNGTLLGILGGVAFGAGGLVVANSLLGADRDPPVPGWSASVDSLERFPNVELQTHEGETVRFYDDLIRGKVVALNFMYTSCKGF